jgi:hypothetical protein
MNGFFQKNKKLLIILIVLLLLGLGAIVYFFVLDGSFGSKDVNSDENQVEMQEEEVTPLPDFDEKSSSEAIEATSTAALAWSSDAKLYNCSGLPTSMQYPDITYEYVGSDQGKYYRWMCTYYSAKKRETIIYGYVEGELDDDTEAMDIGEYGDLLYGDIDYPTDLTGIVDSTTIYADALSNGLDETNYVNMYLEDSSDYGFVWKLEERSKTEKDEYDIGVIINTYIYDIITGKLEDIVQEEVY